MAQMNTDFSSGPLDYSSAEFKQIPLSTWILFYSTRISRISQIFPPDHLFFWTRIARIKRIFFIRTIGLFHPHGKIRVHPCAKNIRVRELFVFKEKIRVHPSVWQKHLLFERFVFKERIRVHLCLSVCQKHSLFERFVFKKNLCSSVQSVGE